VRFEGIYEKLEVFEEYVMQRCKWRLNLTWKLKGKGVENKRKVGETVLAW